MHSHTAGQLTWVYLPCHQVCCSMQSIEEGFYGISGGPKLINK